MRGKKSQKTQNVAQETGIIRISEQNVIKETFIDKDEYGRTQERIKEGDFLHQRRDLKVAQGKLDDFIKTLPDSGRSEEQNAKLSELKRARDECRTTLDSAIEENRTKD